MKSKTEEIFAKTSNIWIEGCPVVEYNCAVAASDTKVIRKVDQVSYHNQATDG